MPDMPDLPPGSGILQGKIGATFVIQTSGRASNVAVDVSELRLDGEPVNLEEFEAYATESLYARKFSRRSEPCRVTFSAWVN